MWCTACIFIVLSLTCPFIVTGTVETNESAVGSETGTRIENAVGPDHVNAVGGPVPEKGTGRGTGRWLGGMKAVRVAGAESERESVGGGQEETAGAGSGVETGKGGAGVGIARETGREARGWMGRRLVR